MRASGPLSVHPDNGRYFTDGSGKAVYLTGSHTWANFQERWLKDKTPKFNFQEYLRFLKQHNHNFMRMWVWEHAAWMQYTEKKISYEPLPYERTGPGNALDGLPKFDLSRLNQKYFDRLYYRVSIAHEHGIYVSVMLFQGFSIEQKGTNGIDHTTGNPWDGHPFNKKNNVNGIDGDLNSDGIGLEVHTLSVPAITALQEAYVRKVVDTLNELDNVLWEVSNESHSNSTDWQYHIIRFIKSYEAKKKLQHPIGMTFQWPGGNNNVLFKSPADWISPNSDGGYLDDPPTSQGRKVIIADSDHIRSTLRDPAWAWKSFLRGLNPIMMDRYKDTKFFPIGTDEPALEWNGLRRALGNTLRYANRINLASMIPREDLASSGYCLAKTAERGAEYLIYVALQKAISKGFGIKGKLYSFFRYFIKDASRAKVTVDLSDAKGDLQLEWFNPRTSVTSNVGATTAGSVQTFHAPFYGDAVLYIHDTKSTDAEH